MMRITKLVAAALASWSCLAAEAVAADIDNGGSMLDPPVVVQADHWSGFSLGGGLGGMFVDSGVAAAGTFDADTTTPATIDTFSLSDENTEGALFGTLQLGYDRRLQPGFVIGVFADYDLSRDNETSFSAATALPLSGAPGDQLTVSGSAEVEDSWTVGGRLGYLVNPAILVYGLIGWTHADVNVSGAYSTNIGGSTPIPFSESDGLDAVTVGAGVETLLQPGFSVKLEYRYTDLASISTGTSLATLAGLTSDGASTLDLDTDIHTVRAVLIWRPGL
jgi:outer membrane immunogenic protein